MKTFQAGSCDIAVIGAGHAGIEAALAAARLGLETLCFTVNLDSVGNMPCNPAIGGTGKGHLVRELDALGGEMSRAADRACIQYRMLNLGKGPAVHSLRAQADRRRYQAVLKQTLERQEHLHLRQAEIVSIGVEEGRVVSVTTHTGGIWRCRAVIIASGTYLDGRTIVGEALRREGPDGLAAAIPLAEELRALGLSMRRFKTGTPPRVNARTVDFSKMELQQGDAEPEPFSFETETPPENRAVCYLTYTNERTHAILRAALDRSPLYTGTIEGVGPRYCPSIETKIVRFPEKPYIVLWAPEYGNPVWHNEGDSAAMMPTITERYHPDDWPTDSASMAALTELQKNGYITAFKQNQLRLCFMKNLTDSGFVFLGVYCLSSSLSDTTKLVWERCADEVTDIESLDLLRP